MLFCPKSRSENRPSTFHQRMGLGGGLHKFGKGDPRNHPATEASVRGSNPGAGLVVCYWSGNCPIILRTLGTGGARSTVVGPLTDAESAVGLRGSSAAGSYDPERCPAFRILNQSCLLLGECTRLV